MIICRTPMRMSFFGGGTDLPQFYEKEGGCVISTAIDKYIYLTAHQSFDNDYKLFYNKFESKTSINDIENTRAREILKKLKIKPGIEIHSVGEIPAGTGLGSSSSYTVGLLNLLRTMNGDRHTKQELAEEACKIEIDDLKEPIGKQDQYAAALGGFNFIEFKKDGTTRVTPINISKGNIEKIEERICAFYLDKTRSASKVLREQGDNMKNETSKFDAMKKLKQIALDARIDLENGKIDNFGKRLHESWLVKKSVANSISDSFIDEVYQKGLDAGAQGGKVLGAGGGGVIIFYCEPEKQGLLRQKLGNLRELKFSFEDEGSKIIYNK